LQPFSFENIHQKNAGEAEKEEAVRLVSERILSKRAPFLGEEPSGHEQNEDAEDFFFARHLCMPLTPQQQQQHQHKQFMNQQVPLPCEVQIIQCNLLPLNLPNKIDLTFVISFRCEIS